MNSKFNKEPCTPAQMASIMVECPWHWDRRNGRARRLLLHWWVSGISGAEMKQGYQLVCDEPRVTFAVEPTEVGKIIQKAYRDKCRKASR